jgi:putative hydrolase of the HAD superfamily
MLDFGHTRAVVFDFFGTLTVHATAEERRRGADRVANALGVPTDLFFDRLSCTFTERATGSCGDLPETLTWVAQRCGYMPSADQIAAACAERRAVEVQYARSLRSDASTTLAELRQRGMRLGVISDCTHELPECWSTLPIAKLIDCVVFSVEVGVRKPDPFVYQLMCDQLNMKPAEVCYVGDGGSNELSGAEEVGMNAVQLLSEDAAAALVYDRETGWEGPVICELIELLG